MSKNSILIPAQEVPVLKEAEVVVAGGGIAGLAAAIASARCGAKTLLIERYGCLGGTISGVPMKWVGGYNAEIHGGIMAELIDKLRQTDGIIREFYNENVSGYMVGVYIDIFKTVTLKMLEDAGVELLLHTLVTDVISERGEITGLVIENKSGRQVVLGKRFIDATGDGDVAARAGAAYQKGDEESGKMQAMTHYGPVLEGVDNEVLLDYLLKYKDKYSEEIVEWSTDLPRFSFAGFSRMLKDNRQKGTVYLDYDCIWISGEIGTDRTTIDGSFVPFMDGTDVLDLTYAETESIKQIASFVTFAKQNFPGFENSHRRDRGGFSIGVRETRRVMGEYLLTEEDILQGKKFLDGIGCNCTPMDIHSSGGHQSWTQVKTYDIPYRCLISATIDNLLMSGRCISATHKALASVRFIPCCVITGQAAGTAAALTSKGDISLKELDTNKLLAELKGQGVILTAGNV